MVSFTDEFDRTDGALGSSWQSLNSNNSTSAVVVLDTRAVSNDRSYQAVAWRIATASLPTTGAQEVGGMVVSATQGSNCHVDLGVMGTTAAASYSTTPLGVWARLAWLSNGVRRLSIHRFLPGDSASATLRTLDVVLSGAVPADGYEGRLRENGTVGYPQQLRLVVTAIDNGLLARAYVNEDDDDRPTLSAVIDRDLLDTGVADQEFGAIWMGFGPSTGAAGDQAVLGVFGGDYDASEDHVAQELREDQPTLETLRQRVRRHYESSTNTSLLDEQLDDAITDAVEDLLNLCGDQAWFLVREASLTITPDTNGVAELQPVMRRVHEIVDGTNRKQVWFKLLYHSTQGAPVVRMNTTASGTYLVRYTLRHAQIKQPYDPLPIPREYQEAVVMGACQKLARRDRKANLAVEFGVEYQRLTLTMLRDLSRHSNAARGAFKPQRLSFGYWA